METNNLLSILSDELPAAGSYTISAGSIGTANVTIGTSINPVGYFIKHPSINGHDAYDNIVDRIEVLIEKLSITEDENQLNAVKHLTYAKAFLEKMLLDKINEKTNGHS